MSLTIYSMVSLLAGFSLAGCVVGENAPMQEEEIDQDEIKALVGNGSPSGAHYNLNIIGVPKGKTADMTGNMGHRIFVPESGSARINLQEGDFQVLDANGTDGTARFQLPSPDPDGDGLTVYSVFARALGAPGGMSTTTTCATEAGETFCSAESLVLVRNSGKSTFTNVTKQLLFLSVDIDGDGDLDRVPLFSGGLDEFFWQYDNANLKLAQLRFYEIVTNVN